MNYEPITILSERQTLEALIADEADWYEAGLNCYHTGHPEMVDSMARLTKYQQQLANLKD